MHEPFLLAALEQARFGQGHCAPNPCVGAVAVQHGKIIAQAWHRGAGTAHAEQLVLAQIAPNTPGVSLYITLEPCNHWGRTPPCVGAISQHGIEKVIFAYLDPNPIVAQNDSSTQLRDHGIEVIHYPLAEIDSFYTSYAHWALTKRPRVTVKMAQTLDGKIAGPNGQRVSISNARCEQWTHQMRAKCDVILTSARTIQADNPKMTVRINGNEEARPIAIIDPHLDLNHDFSVFSTGKHCHVYHHSNRPVDYPNTSFYPISLKDGKINLEAVIMHLGLLGYHDVWVEVGGVLFAALHDAGLVNRTYLYIAPLCLGQHGIGAYQHARVFDRAHTVSWQVMGDNVMACLDWKEDECLLD